MLNVWVKLSVLCAFVSVTRAEDFGHGRWDFVALNKCEQDSHKFKFDINLKEVNDTHESFKGRIVLNEAFTDAFGVRIEIGKYSDDKCQPFQVIADDSLFDFFNKYAEDNVKSCFEAAGINPVELPIQKGELIINEYVLYKQLTDGMFGSFCIKIFVLQGEEEVGCLGVQMDFNELKKDDKGDGK